MAMSQEHRKRLISKRVALVTDIQLEEELLSHLMAKGIITSDNKELIEVCVVFFLLFVHH